jgi:hypothetical protein
MSAYLRPETLFSSKFESYLNETGGPVENDSSATDVEAEKWADILND